MINNKAIGRKLKELRNSRDLKQSELAELVGLSRPAISNIESGKRSLTLPTAPIAKDIFASFLLHQSVHHTVEYVNNKYGLSRPYMSYMHILKNEFYAGSYRGNSNYAEPYITKETYNAVLN